MYAQISLVGRVTHDVELRARATTGEPYLLLGLAVNEGYKDHVHTSFYQCWLEADEATRASKAGVRKGSLLFVNGQLSVAARLTPPFRPHQPLLPARQPQLPPPHKPHRVRTTTTPLSISMKAICRFDPKLVDPDHAGRL